MADLPPGKAKVAFALWTPSSARGLHGLSSGDINATSVSFFVEVSRHASRRAA
jgi:hypothetical protein